VERRPGWEGEVNTLIVHYDRHRTCQVGYIPGMSDFESSDHTNSNFRWRHLSRGRSSLPTHDSIDSESDSTTIRTDQEILGLKHVASIARLNGHSHCTDLKPCRGLWISGEPDESRSPKASCVSRGTPSVAAAFLRGLTIFSLLPIATMRSRHSFSARRL
jgi:hypothetical protein